MTTDLRPCPFCNGANVIDEGEYAFCENCDVRVWIGDEGVSAWNTRPIEDDLRNRIAELEAESERVFDLVRELRTYCIFANWDNPDTEDDFNEFDVEVCKWLSKYMEREE